MITFLDERDVEHGALATIKVTNAVNGERSLTGEIESGDYVLTNIERGWRLRFDDEFYVVTYAKPIDDGKGTHVTFDAVHQFFWDFDKSSVHEQLNDGSHTFLTYLDFIFTGSDYTYTIDPLLKVYAFEKQSFGYKSRLKLFNDVITSSGVEFQVNGKVVRILEKTGTDLSTVVRKNFNMNELGIEKHIGDFVTYQKGFGAWIDENDHSKGRLVTEYTSPLASVYGKLEAEPLVDERYTQADNMIAALKANVDNSYSISITLDMEDLTRAGYDYTQPRAGDYIMAINETLDFQEKIRIVSFTSEYDVSGQLVKHEVTCNDIGVVKKLSASYNLTKEQAQNASDSVGKAVEMANKALVSADGKSTVYFGNEFPKNEPKGTLHKGDSLYLTVGDTTKMYYWTGADWEELPIVNDVEAFKEQIADELKDVPNREEFEATITEKLATSKAEIKTQIDTAKTQAESNAKAYADEINQATAEVAEQANTAANSLKSDLAKVKTDLTTTTSTANAAKASVSEAKQQLTTIANNLSKAKQDLRTQASQLKTEAVTEATHLLNSLKAETVTTSNQLKQRIDATSAQLDTQQQELAQATQNVKGLNTQIKSVSSQLGTQQTTITQLVNDGNARGQKIANFETSLDGVTTKLQNLWNGSRNLLSNTERLTGYEGVLPYPKNHYLNKAVFRWTHKATDTEFKEGLVMQVNDMLVNPKEMILSFYANASTQTTVRCYMYNPNGRKDVETSSGYTATDSADGLAEVVIQPGWNRYWVRYTYKVGYVAKPYVIIGRSADTVKVTTTLSIVAPALYHGHYNRDWQPSDIDMSSAFAVYKQTVDQNLAQLGADIRTTNGSITSMQTEFNQTKADIGLLAKQADFDTLTQKTQSLEATLKVQAGKIDLKAEKTLVDNLSQQVTNTQAELTVANDAIAQRVTKTDFNAVKRTAEANATAITQVNNAIELKAEKTYVEGVKSTADSALAKANANTNTITQTKAELRIANDAIDTKATKVDLNNLTGRMSTAETTIRTQAGLIEQRLTSTQVESAINAKGYQTATQVNSAIASKGYQTKDDVDSNITGRGYITDSALAPYALTTTVQNLVKETSDSFSRSISETKALIPTEIGSSNLLRNTAVNGDNLKLFGASNSTINVAIKDGHQAYKIVVSTTGNSGVMFNGNAGHYNLIKDRYYTFSFWVLTNKDKTYSSGSLGHIQAINSNSDKVGNDAIHQHTTPVYSTNTVKANTWTKVWCTFKATSNSYFKPYFWYLTAGDEIYIYDMMLNEGRIPLSYTLAIEDTQSDITKLSNEIKQTADGMTLLATKTELNTAKSDLQSGITTATNKANTAQSTADSNAKTISTHTTQISALNTGLQAKVSKTDFNTLSGRVTTAENNITAKANELSSKISSLNVGSKNYLPTSRVINRGCSNFSYSKTSKSWTMTVPASSTTFGNGITFNTNGLNILLNGGETLFFGLMIKANKACSFNYDINNALSGTASNDNDDRSKQAWSPSNKSIPANVWTRVWFSYTAKANVPITEANSNFGIVNNTEAITVEIKEVMVAKSNVPVDYQTPDADFEAKDSELKQTTDSIKASVSSLDKSTVKSASLTINTDGIVMKAGKSTTDIANAIGSYFAVNQNAINLFSDKINVKANMIVDGAITSTKIASKSINTAHLNGKIITADVISSNAITADAIKAGAVTTDKMTANSINGDRITAGTLDAAKIKAGSITASQIASGTITSSQIKAGGINTANIAAGAITTDKIISGAIDGDKIAANAITADKIATNALTAGLIQGGILKSRTNSIKWDLDHSDLTFSEKGKIVFTNTDNTISYTKKQTTGLLKFNDADYNAPEVTLGINRSGAFATNDGTFTGVRVRGYKYSNGTFIDEVYNIGDKIILTGGYNENNGFLFQTAGDNLGFFPRANRRYALGSPGRRFTTLYLDDVNIRISSTKTYSLREVIGTLAGLAGVRL